MRLHRQMKVTLQVVAGRIYHIFRTNSPSAAKCKNPLKTIVWYKVIGVRGESQADTSSHSGCEVPRCWLLTLDGAQN